MRILMDIFVDPCNRYEAIQDSSRLVTTQDFVSVQCDRDDLFTSWFRFSNSNSSDVMMLTHCPPLARCQTISPGWMNGSHPTGIYVDKYGKYPRYV